MELAKKFFDLQYTKANKIKDFFESDLHFYLQNLYGNIKFIEEKDRSKHFFISVSSVMNELFFTERIFAPYDWGQPLGYIIPESLEYLVGKTFEWEENVNAFSLSKNGFFTYELVDNEKDFIDKLPELPYSNENSDYDSTRYYRFTSKYSNANSIKDPIHLEAVNIMNNALPNSTFIKEMDYYNSNFLHYPKGTSIAPHNDIDVCSFVDAVFYSGSDDSKQTIIGEFDWYDKVFGQLFIGGLGDKDIQNKELLEKKIYTHKNNASSAIIFNFFNPKFYHEVPATLTESYTGLVFGSFKEIMNDKEIEW